MMYVKHSGSGNSKPKQNPPARYGGFPTRSCNSDNRKTTPRRQPAVQPTRSHPMVRGSACRQLAVNINLVYYLLTKSY